MTKFTLNLMTISKELLKGSTTALVLAVLKDGRLYGYEIIKKLKVESKSMFEFGEGTIYPILHLLEKQELLSSEWVAQDSGPDRKYYSLTPKGSKMLESKKAEWKQFSDTVDKVLGINVNAK